MSRDLPLTCEATENGTLRIEIGSSVLKWVTEKHEHFWDGESDLPFLKVDDQHLLLEEIVRELNAEEEDGSTFVTAMIDDAIQQAIEKGCEGVDHEYEPSRTDA